MKKLNLAQEAEYFPAIDVWLEETNSPSMEWDRHSLHLLKQDWQTKRTIIDSWLKIATKCLAVNYQTKEQEIQGHKPRDNTPKSKTAQKGSVHNRYSTSVTGMDTSVSPKRVRPPSPEEIRRGRSDTLHSVHVITNVKGRRTDKNVTQPKSLETDRAQKMSPDRGYSGLPSVRRGRREHR